MSAVTSLLTALRRGGDDGVDMAPPLVTRATTPRVNLLPPSYRESDRLRAVQSGLAVGVLAAAAVVSLGTLSASGAREDAALRAETARASNAAIQGQIAEISGVREVYAEVERREALLGAARGSEVSWSRVLNDLSITIPDGVWIENMVVSPTVGAADPATASLGSISFTGRGRSHDDVATWIETLSAQDGLVGATFSTSTLDTTLGRPTVTFSSTVTVTAEALTTETEAS